MDGVRLAAAQDDDCLLASRSLSTFITASQRVLPSHDVTFRPKHRSTALYFSGGDFQVSHR